MRLRHITFTGIDVRTDLQELQDIQQRYPMAEFGVLTSYHWNENGNRYLNPQSFPNLYGRELNLALHICGSMASDATKGLWERINQHTLSMLEMQLFQRVQLNVANRPDTPERLASTPIPKRRSSSSNALVIQSFSSVVYVETKTDVRDSFQC